MSDNMKTGPSREKYWHDMNTDEKNEQLSKAVLNLLHMIDWLRSDIDYLVHRVNSPEGIKVLDHERRKRLQRDAHNILNTNKETL